LSEKELKREKVDTLSYKTQSAKKEEVEHSWHLVDATNMTVGRLCSQLAHVLRGKHKPSYTPHVDCGDNIVVLNAEKVRFTGNKWSQKEYLRHTGYPGGQRSTTAEEMLEKKPTAIIEKGVRGMLPKNETGPCYDQENYLFMREQSIRMKRRSHSPWNFTEG
jgi:large subunit ribosomal protein L13